MIGVVLVAHGGLAQEYLNVLEQIVGPQDHIAAIGIANDDDLEKKRSEILSHIKAVDLGQGVLVLTDMFGGTPSNLSISLLDKQNIEVVAGLNLPMLIKLASSRKSADLKQLVVDVQDAGKRYIHVATQLLQDKS